MKLYSRLSIERRTCASPIHFKMDDAGKFASVGAGVGSAFGPVGGVIGAGAGALLGTLSNIYSGNKNFNRQRALQDREFGFTREMADQQWERSLQMFDMENAYNSPEMQRYRFEQAGINPFVAFNNGNAGNVASDGAAPSLPATPSAPTPAPFSLGNVTGSISEMASAINALSQADKTGTETDQLKKLFKFKLESEELNVEAQRIAVDIAQQCKQYDIDVRKESVQKLIADIAEIQARTNLEIAEEKLTQQNIDNAKEQLELLKKTGAKTDAERELIEKQIKWYDTEARSRVNLNNANAYKATEEGKTQASVRAFNWAAANNQESQAKLNDALRTTEDEMRQHKIQGQELQNLSLGANVIFSAIQTMDNHNKIMEEINSLSWQRKREMFQLVYDTFFKADRGVSVTLPVLGKFGIEGHNR